MNHPWEPWPEWWVVICNGVEILKTPYREGAERSMERELSRGHLVRVEHKKTEVSR